ncbi:SAM-dependent methyltransferase [Clostridium botulinum]
MKTKDNYNKLRGGYYTSNKIADFITKWAIRDSNVNILEPSCGDGSFIYTSVNRLKDFGINHDDLYSKVLGIELDEEEASKARSYGANIINCDFFSYYKDNIYKKNKFDVILGNPPFIRYQNFNKEFREIAFGIMQELGFKPNKLTNIWLPFLILSSYALSNNGRLGMVIPAELFQVDYAAETRAFLSEYFDKLTIITFKKLLFEDAQQEVVLLLGEKTSINKGIQAIELESSEELKDLEVENIEQYEIKELDHDSEKWVKYYLSNKEINLMRRLRNSPLLTNTTDLFEVNVGVVSGQNDFFIMNKSTVEKYNLRKHTRDIVGKADHVKGIIFNNSNLKELEDANKKVFIFTPNNLEYENLSEEEKLYIDFGVEQEYNTGYKCRIRKLWYIVPQSWYPEAFMLRQVHACPKIIVNQTEATTTDTLHKIRFKKNVNPNHVACSFINSFTFALCEITGRSYGGGVLTFEPGEVRKLLIPMRGAEKLNIDDIDQNLRKDKIGEVLDNNDSILLKENLGLNDDEILMLRGIWEKLRDRRINRKKKRRSKG